KIIGDRPARTSFEVISGRNPHQHVLVSPVKDGECSCENNCIPHQSSVLAPDEISSDRENSGEQREKDSDDRRVEEVFVKAAQQKNYSGARGEAHSSEGELAEIFSAIPDPNEAAEEQRHG